MTVKYGKTFHNQYEKLCCCGSVGKCLAGITQIEKGRVQNLS